MENESSPDKDVKNVEETNLESDKNTPDAANDSEEKEKNSAPPKIVFKKPDIVTGPRKDKLVKTKKSDEKVEPEAQGEKIPEGEENKKNPVTVPYQEPAWSGKPDKEYKVEVLKSGVILEVIDLSQKSYHVIGRLPACDVSLAHPTISRYHAILQYRKIGNDNHGEGLYVYDLGSTHGTFWNSNRIKPHVYVRIRGGHMLKFGCSQRKFIFLAPPEDEEPESSLTVTELKEKRKQELEEAEKLSVEKEDSQGIDWGMGEDAEEETDISENPFAQTNNEELFLDDPKKTLRGWFEREGYDMQYQTEERGIGQFLCWVDLPIDTPTGKSVRAEALVKGKKKESVVQCALEACRILDRHGLLRQSSHESRKRKSRNWEEDDYYDSDEDNFLDRTGTIERKRKQRMRTAGKLSSDVETYDSLVEKYTDVATQIEDIEKKLLNVKKALNENSDDDADALDAFMDNLSSNTMNKSDITELKVTLNNIRKDEAQLLKLINIAKPANLPVLRPILPSSEKVAKSKVEKPNIQSSEKPENPDESREEKLSKKDEMTTENVQSLKEETRLEMETHVGTEENIEQTESSDTKEKIEEPSKKIETKPTKPPKRWRKHTKEKQNANFSDEANSEDYSTWVPPMNQSGDGRTNLNDKYGY